MNTNYPPKPEEVLQSDCCGNGCTSCVFDIYEQELEIWKKQCAQIDKSVSLSHDADESFKVMFIFFCNFFCD